MCVLCASVKIIKNKLEMKKNQLRNVHKLAPFQKIPYAWNLHVAVTLTGEGGEGGGVKAITFSKFLSLYVRVASKHLTSSKGWEGVKFELLCAWISECLVNLFSVTQSSKNFCRCVMRVIIDFLSAEKMGSIRLPRVKPNSDITERDITELYCIILEYLICKALVHRF